MVELSPTFQPIFKIHLTKRNWIELRNKRKQQYSPNPRKRLNSKPKQNLQLPSAIPSKYLVSPDKKKWLQETVQCIKSSKGENRDTSSDVRETEPNHDDANPLTYQNKDKQAPHIKTKKEVYSELLKELEISDDEEEDVINITTESTDEFEEEEENERAMQEYFNNPEDFIIISEL